MDDIAPASQTPQAAPTTPAPSPKAPQTKPESFQNSRAFIIIPAILIVVAMVAGAYLITTRPLSQSATSSILSTSTLLPTLPNTTSSIFRQTSTTTVSQEVYNSACHCPNIQQFEIIFNDSTGYTANATLNVLQIPNESLAGTTLFDQPPGYIVSNLTTGWSISYMSSLTRIPYDQASDNFVATEEKAQGFSIESKNSIQLYGYFQSHLPKLNETGTQNGFVYTYGTLSENIGTGSNEIFTEVVGRKGSYLIFLLFGSQKQIPIQSIIPQLSSTV